MKNRVLTELGRWARYLYFLRFSLMLWLFAPLVCVVNMFSQTLTSGILTPEFPQGYLCVAFFVVSSGFAALIGARVALINGPERWNMCPPGESEDKIPGLLKQLLVNDESNWEWTAVIVSQVPAGLVFIYLSHYGGSQWVSQIDIWAGLIAGAVLATVVWVVVNVWYYLTYDPREKPWKTAEDIPPGESQQLPVRLGVTAARTILFPRRLFHLPMPGDQATMDALEGAETLIQGGNFAAFSHKLAAAILWLVGRKGFAHLVSGRLYEAQIFAMLAMAVFAALYLTIWPLTAPVPAPVMSIVMLAVLLCLVVFATAVFWSAKSKPGLIRWKVALTVGVWLFWIAVVWLYASASAERFPIFATVMMMVIALCWFLAGVAFVLDRYRVPVLTLLVVVAILPRLPHISILGGTEEHYFSVVSVQRSEAYPVPTPAEILLERLNRSGAGQPLIIVTATGGGLHASAWTAAMLAHLESEFVRNDGPSQEPFHEHLLLLSTVSGGSVGLDAYLRQLYEGKLEGSGLDQMQAVAQCSSLEAVGWGLIYYDLPKAIIPGAPYVLPPASGDGDLSGYLTPLYKDRTWSLRKAFERNHNNTYCNDLWTDDMKADESRSQHDGRAQNHLFVHSRSMFRGVLWWNLAAQRESRKPGGELTLRTILPAGTNDFPAFTMNTTAAETGGRFLLANYRVPHYALDETEDYPAQSFLADFGKCGAVSPDLPLATAAQLSATFPYVSSAERAPKSIDCRSVHFVDGGYYDNDGTASAIEFLRYAMASPDKAKNAPAAEKQALGQVQAKLQKAPLRILWIEIRNSQDPGGGGASASGGNGALAHATNSLGQVGDVPLAFWNAGHESVTGRNRQALALLEGSMPCKLQVHRIVLTDSGSLIATGTDPLNWSLTPRQRAEVRTDAERMQQSYVEAKGWFSGSTGMWNKAQKMYYPSCPGDAPTAQTRGAAQYARATH